jgi:hypothetical protein
MIRNSLTLPGLSASLCMKIVVHTGLFWARTIHLTEKRSNKKVKRVVIP